MVGLDNFSAVPFFHVIGKLGVVLFFVLSGFLITYLLLTEEDSCGNIDTKKFYLRRIVRIWPLYFFILFLAFAILPFISFLSMPGFSKEWIFSDLGLKLAMYALFLSNLVIPILGVVPYASHLWSIGTEEQFYLFWPLFMKLVTRHRIAFLLLIIIGHLGVEHFLNIVPIDLFPYRNIFRSFWHHFAIGCMAIGGVFAILLFQRHNLISLLTHNYTFGATSVLLAFLILVGHEFSRAHFEIYAVLFGILILNLTSNPKCAKIFEFPALKYLGQISYGLYMYHTIGIFAIIQLGLALNSTSNWFIYPASIALTVVMAGMSYRYLEAPFLKLKKAFSPISSGYEN